MSAVIQIGPECLRKAPIKEAIYEDDNLQVQINPECTRIARSGLGPTRALNLQHLWQFGRIFPSFTTEITSCRTSCPKMEPKGSRAPSKVEAKHRFKLIWALFCVFLHRFSRPAGRGVHGRGVRGEGKPSLFRGSERTSTEGSTDFSSISGSIREPFWRQFGCHAAPNFQ